MSVSVLGTSVPRKEDARLLTGRGRYVSDLRLPGMLHVAFVRSPLAHGRIRGVDADAARAAPGVVAVVTGDDPEVAGRELRARSSLSSYVETAQPLLARDRVRFNGEAVAAVVATDRYLAEDAADLVVLDGDPLPAVVDARAACAPGCAAVVHEEAPDNVLVRRRFEAGDVDSALAAAHLVVERELRTNRHAGVPLEGRAGVASWDAGDGTLTLWSGTQIPHMIRHGIAELLGLPERRVRVLAPDVGGGFGVKASLYPEDALLCVLAIRLGRPVRWVEDRLEHLLSASHARDHVYRVRAGLDADGTVRALDADVICNAGAYSLWPYTAALEPLMAGGLLAGPYRVDHYRCEVRGVATNTAPSGPYRGVARPATVFVMERMLDIAAAALGLDPVAVRRRNLVRAEDVPYTSATRLVHDSRTYGACLDAVLERLDYAAVRDEQRRMRGAGRALGVGLAVYNELTGMGSAASAGPRMPFRTGYEMATVRLDPEGGVTVLAGTTSQGQGLETTLAQIAADELGVAYDDVDVRMGDTQGPYGFGAFASRQGVIGGGAVLLAARAVRDRIVQIAAHLLEAAEADLRVEDGRVRPVDAPDLGISIADVARVAYHEAHRLPEGMSPGLEETRTYDPVRGTFAAGAQAAVVEVDRTTGEVRVLRHLCVEDAGRVYHPAIVAGQIEGGLAQGIGGALHEHHVYDPDGRLMTATLMDYLLPAATDVPAFEVGHVDDPAATVTGARGVGEGSTLGVAAALANAVADALSPWGVETNTLPLTPSRIHAALEEAT
ncbi:MAG: xanthine dehydrogenase family protein [Chloroflexi bacterium]|nr:MAG: xanthine dehydrogenase family protein [Chloroflexota bacterium]